MDGKEKGLDHWSPGACTALLKYRINGLGAALCIQGHHIGLQHGQPKPLAQELDLAALNLSHPQNLRVTETDPRILLQQIAKDSLVLPASPRESIYAHSRPHDVARMLDLRMLFSVLVDADYIETEAHFQGDLDGTKRYRPEGPSLDPARALDILSDHLHNLQQQSTAAGRVNSIRDDLLEACLHTAELPPGLFTLTAPTGAGKTLAILAFALKHAQQYNSLRRIVMVIPYLTIIEQTAGVYQNIFEPHFGPHYVLENHSLAGIRGNGRATEQDNEDIANRTAGLLAENWDAPLVLRQG